MTVFVRFTTRFLGEGCICEYKTPLFGGAVEVVEFSAMNWPAMGWVRERVVPFLLGLRRRKDSIPSFDIVVNAGRSFGILEVLEE